MGWIHIGDVLEGWVERTRPSKIRRSSFWWDWRNWLVGVKWGRWSYGDVRFVEFHLGPLMVNYNWGRDWPKD